VVREFTTSDPGSIFDLRLIAGVSSNSPVLHSSSTSRRALLRRALSTVDGNPQPITIDVVYTDGLGAEFGCLANPQVIYAYDNQEVELLVNVPASDIGGPCPKLGDATEGSYAW